MLSEQMPSSPEQIHITTDSIAEHDPSEELGELRILMDDLEHIDDVIGEAVQVSSELMQEQEAAEQMQAQQEGASQAALESLQRNVNSLIKQVGFEQRAVFASNTFTNKRHNKIALESAVQDIKAFIERLWEGIMAAIRNTVDFVKKIYKHFYDISLKIKRQCESLKEQAKHKNGKTHAVDAKVGSYSLARYLRFDNKALAPSDVLLNYDKWTSHNYNFIESLGGKTAIAEYTGYISKAAEYFSKMDLAAKSDTDDIKKETDALGDLMVRRIVSNFELHKNQIHTTKPYIGDVFYQFDENNLAFTIEKIEGHKELKEERTHKPLSVAQTVELCDKIIVHMGEYERIDKYFDELDKLNRSITSIASEAIKGNAQLDAVQRKIVSSSTSFILKIFIEAIRKVGTGAREYDMQVSRALTNWCALSLATL